MADNQKKQIPLRLSTKLYNQIEYLLTECVRQRKKNGKYVSEELDKPLEIDIE